MKDLNILAEAKSVELVAFREHPYRKGCDVLKHVGDIKSYDSLLYDNENKCILFLANENKGIVKIVDRLQSESVVQIRKGALGAIVVVD